jgi:hypothetical protein
MDDMSTEVPAAPLPDAPGGAEPAPASEAPAEVEETAAPESVEESAPAAEEPAPLWGDEQWTGWDGSKDTLDERYHAIYDRMSDTHSKAVSALEGRLADANESIRALAYDGIDPHADRDLKEAQSALEEAKQRAEAAEQALQEYKSAQEQQEADADAKEEAAFRDRHAWLFEDSADPVVRKAVIQLMDQMLPTQAGDVFKGVDAKKSTIMAEYILKGTPVDVAKELAAMRTAPPKKEALPEKLPGREFVNGAGPANATSRRKRGMDDHPSPKLARELMAEQMFG